MKKGTTGHPQLLNFGWLWWHYWVLEMPLSVIGKLIGCSTQTVLNWFRYHGISTRTYSESETGHLNYFYNNGDMISGENNPFFGKHHTDMTKQKLSGQRKNKHCGENNHFFGKHHTEEAKKKMIAAQIGLRAGEKNPMYGKHHTKEALEKMKKARRHQHFPKHHTKPELIFEEICKKYNLHFKYVGDGSLWIGKDRALNPDFIEANGEKILVEIMGDYWHSPLLNPKVDKIRTLPHRKTHFKKYGWVPIFLWGTDMHRSDVESFVLKTLGEHIG